MDFNLDIYLLAMEYQQVQIMHLHGRFSGIRGRLAARANSVTSPRPHIHGFPQECNAMVPNNWVSP